MELLYSPLHDICFNSEGARNMINGIYLSTMGALVQAERHATIANNLANVNTDGFKPDWVRVRAIPSESDNPVWNPTIRFNIDKVLSKTGGGAWLSPTVSNLREGAYKVTGNPLDLALQNEPTSGKTSFFMVHPAGSPAGTVRYTRSGHFVQAEDGIVRDPSGNTLLSTDGTPINLGDAPQGSIITIHPDGQITAYFDGVNVGLGQVGIRRTADAAQMKKQGDGLFDPQDAEMEVYQNGLEQHTLEHSATSAIMEMVNMIEAQRVYDMNMRFISVQDESLGQSVRRISATA